MEATLPKARSEAAGRGHNGVGQQRAALRSGAVRRDDGDEVWEEMRTEWIDDRLREQLNSLGCPVVGTSAEALFRQVGERKGELARTFDIPRTRGPPSEDSDGE